MLAGAPGVHGFRRATTGAVEIVYRVVPNNSWRLSR
jgi:hypothetical protein